MLKRSLAYKKLCEAALAYKKGYIHEKTFVNYMSGFLCNRLNEEFNSYCSKRINSQIERVCIQHG